MPKRSCPFGEGGPAPAEDPRGAAELSRGVRGEEYRREVSRTRRLLFRGAQAYMEGAGPAAARPPEPEPPGDAQGGGPRWNGQLLIGHDGKLLRRPAERVPPVGASRACSSCVRTTDVKEVCTQCDRFVCQSCSRLCSCCNRVACSLCSTIDYADVGEQVLCNGCSIFQV
ncbi:apoptosis regulatory protein Siva [Manacus vitellinus]|uniref:apoptosis regulatory protein Siva n=1 Tax=Manacus vitellinus TaxID=328815 RepID=UPI00115DF109|nr:apoptosis regulatory protein Siva [Manacus vitellinus]